MVMPCADLVKKVFTLQDINTAGEVEMNLSDLPRRWQDLASRPHVMLRTVLDNCSDLVGCIDSGDHSN
jgi:hypothetical protein